MLLLHKISFLFFFLFSYFNKWIYTFTVFALFAKNILFYTYAFNIFLW
jgi:hypothetical protein